jgi:tripartite-type tricarboxylate transporter receptor subunit TctC
VVRADAPPKDVAGFHAWVRHNPGKLNYGSAGNGTPLHLGGAIDAASIYAANGLIIANSGYGSFGQTPGNVILGFKPGN